MGLTVIFFFCVKEHRRFIGWVLLILSRSWFWVRGFLWF